MNILICTFGTSWQVAAESVGFVNYKNFDLYKSHENIGSINEIRKEYFKEEIDEVWLLGTDGIKISEQFEELKKWFKHIKLNCNVELFQLTDVPDITDYITMKKYASFCYQKMLEARKKTENGKLYISIAGGRKTMSSDLQNAAYIFGADAIIHVLDVGNLPKEVRDASPEFLLASTGYFINFFNPVVIGKFQPNESIDIEGLDLINNQDDIYETIQNELERASNHYSNFDTTDDNFRILYQYKKSILDKLKNTKIGLLKEKQKEEIELLGKLPKTDLHCHLGGALFPSDLEEISNLFRAKFTEFPREKRKNDLVKILFDRNSNKESLEKFIFGKYVNEQEYRNIGIEAYEVLGDIQGSSLLQTEEIIRFAVKRLLDKSIVENVKHLEIRCSPINYTRCGLTGVQVVNAICNEIELLNDKISVSILIIASRHGKMSDIYRHIELVSELKENELFNKYFKGFDLAGNENKRSPEELRNAFLKIMEGCSNITIHAGETMPAKNIWEAVYHLNAERIGHGLTLQNDKILMDKILDRNIGIEMCPSSNFQIRNFRDNYYPSTNEALEYPLKYYLDKGLRVSVNTDNRGISLTNATNELHKAARMTSGGISLWDIFKLIKNGYKTAFVGYEKRKMLIKQAESQIELFMEEFINNEK